ncbi:GIY-YIG nuclease family protein [Halosimplex litoreum]|uniref:GIY-YIG nuclease family protein n=1 Tax=Halosimplex litoreum TaxID=1198301 RepID=A0A7T3FVH4_9EURY|nr:GIY-YIG nuclease family protein [Halosimplex litoreum]QPV61495.1 GIY-YIG nuclease family protein [Halosimplex litoreum]
MSEGTYTLVVELPESATIEVGALDECEFAAGAYAYTGSALGPGGFARVERHRELAAGERDARHWHIDYLLGHPDAVVAAVVRTAGADVECVVGRDLAEARWTERVAGFGASDCDCASHLVYAADGERLRAAVERAHGTAGGASDTDG